MLGVEPPSLEAVSRDGTPGCALSDSAVRRGAGTLARVINSDAGLQRIRHLEEQLSRAPIHSGRHRLLARAIRIEAELYRKALDTAQASERFDERRALPVTGRFSRLGLRVKSRGLV